MLLFLATLSGCSVRSQEGGESTMTIPAVRMAFVKIPLNGQDAGENVLDDEEPIERFTASNVPVSYSPSW